MSPSLSSQVSILAFGRVVAFAVMFFVPLVNVRTLTIEEYGYYRQFWLLFATLSPLIMLGLPRSLLYFLPRAESREEKAAFVSQTLLGLTVCSLVAWAVYQVMGHSLGAGFGELVRSFYWRLVAFTFLMMMTEYMETLFIAEGQAVQQAFYSTISSVVQSTAVIVASWGTRDLQAIVWVLVVVAFARFAFVMGYTLKTYAPSLRLVRWAGLREQFGYSIPLGMAHAAFLLQAQADKFIINRFLGREAFAIYVVGAFQVPMVAIFRQSISNVTLPVMARYHKEGRLDEMRELWQRATLKTSLVFFPVFALLLAVADPFIVTLFTEHYAAAAPVFVVYLFVFLRTTVDYTGMIVALKQNGYLNVWQWVGLAGNVALSVLLFHAIGRLGIPIATAVIMYLLMFVMVRRAARLLGSSLRRVLPWGALGFRLLVALVPAALVYWARIRYNVNSIIDLAVVGIAYAVLYLLLAFLTRILRWSDVRALIRMGD